MPEPQIERCSHFRSAHLVPGWGCCKCRCYNGYQRPFCRSCNHPHCYETESKEGKEALELQSWADQDKIRLWLAAHPEPVELKTETLADGRKIAYSNETEFLIQVGRYAKGSYKTKYRITGDLHQALLWYLGINIGKGYKKRLLMPSDTKHPVLFRAVSQN